MRLLRKNALSLGLLAFVAFAKSSRAQTQTRPGNTTKKAPAQATAKAAAPKPAPLEVPQLRFEKYKLENGLEVIFSEDHRLPLVAVNLWDHVGPANELPGRTRVSHLFEHIMFEGSRHLPGSPRLSFLQP